MALAVCLLFDPRGDRLMRELWARLERDGVRTLATHTHGRHHPHLSYAVLIDWDLERVRSALGDLVAEGPFPLSFHGTVAFPRGRAALAPAVSVQIARRQETVAETLVATGATLHRHYVPGSWIPHVSLATGANGDQLPIVVKAVADVLPLTVTAERAMLIDTSTGTSWSLPSLP
jgi:2'-5' RNA ligase